MSPSDTRIRRLQQTPLFGGTSDETVSFVLSRAGVVEAAAGEWILREGERGVALFWLDEGEASISRHHDGQQVELFRLAAGDVFGEMAVFDLGPRSASVCAVKDCRALEIDGELLRKLAERDIEQFALLTMNLARELARRLRRLQRLLLERGEPWQDQEAPPCT